MSVNGVAPAQNAQTTRDRDEIGPALPSYLPNQDETFADAAPADTVTAAGSSGVNNTGGTNGAPDSRAPEYLDNSNAYRASLNAGDAMNGADSAVGDMMNGLSGQDFITGPDGDYQTINGAKLADIMAYIARLTTLEMQMKMLTEAQGEVSEKMMEILLELKPEEGDTSADAARDAFFKSLKSRLTIIQQFMTSVYKAVYNHNFEIYNEKIKKLEESKDRPWYEDTWNFVSGGSEDIDVAEHERDETHKFNESIKTNLHELMTALEALATACSAMGGPVNEGIAASLRELNDRIAQANVKLDQPIVTLNDPDNPMAGAKVADYYDEDDAKDFLENILTQVRGKMVAIENTGRAETYLQTAQMEESQAIMEILLDLSPHASRAEYAYFGQEAVSKLSNMFFDASFNTLMARIQFYNQEVLIVKNIQKLEEMQGWRVLGTIAVLASIVVACATYGSSTPATIALVGALSAGGAALQSYGTYEASQIDDHYDASDPSFSLGASPISGSQPKNVQEAVNYAEAQEEALINSMGSAGLLIKGKDGFYAVNAQALAAFDIRQQAIQNLAKMIVYLNKAMRDLGRSVTAIIEGFAVKDFGDGYLLGNLDNTLQQRQLVMQAIKFQVQEEVTAKNIARQNELMGSKAFKSTGWGIAGMVAGFVIGYFLPGSQFIGVLMSLGGAAGSSGYQIYDLETSSTSSLHNDASELNTHELDRLLEQRNRNAVNSTVAEDKLTMYENALFAELAANGYVGTGDGYHNVNFVLVGKIYNLLMKVETLRTMLAQLREGQFKLSAAVRQQIMGTSASDLSSFGKIITQGSFNQALQILQGVTKFLSEKAQVMNRQRDAAKQLRMAEVSLVVSTAASAASVVCAYAGPAAAKLALAGATAFNTLVTGTINLISEIDWATSGYGDYQQYKSDPEKAIKDVKGSSNEPDDDPFNNLDNLETQIYQQAGENLARTLDGGSWVVDGEQTGILNSRLHALSNLRKMLTTLISGQESLSSLVRRNLRAGGAQGVDELGEFASAKERAAQNILNCLTQGIDVIVERHNQMSQAEREAVMTGFSMALEVAIVVLSSVAEDKRVEANATAEEYQHVNQAAQHAVDPAAVNAQPAGAAKSGEAAKPEAAAASKAAKVNAAPTNRPAQPAEAGKTPEYYDAHGTKVNLKNLAEKTNNLNDSYRHYEQLLAGLGATNAVMNYYMGNLYDWRHGDVKAWESDSGDKKAKLNSSALDANRASRSGQAKGEVEGSQRALSTGSASSASSGDIFDTINGLDTIAEQAEVDISKYSTQSIGELAAQKGEQFAKQWLESLKQGAEGARYLGKGNAPAPYFKLDDNNVHAAPAIDFKQSGVDAVAKFYIADKDPTQQIVNQVAAGKLDKAQAEKVLDRMAQIRPDLKDQVTAAKAALAGAQPQAAPLRPKTEVKVDEANKPGNTSNTNLLAQADKLKAEFEEKSLKAVRQIKANTDAVKNSAATLEEASFALDGEKAAKTPEEKLAALKALRDDLRQKMAALDKTMKELTEQLPVLKAQAAKLGGQANARMAEIDRLLKDGTATMTAAEQADLRAEKKMLEQVEPKLRLNLMAHKSRLEATKGSRFDIMSQLKGVQRLMVQTERERGDQKVKASGSALAQAAKPQAQVVAAAARVAYNKQEETFQQKAERARKDEQSLLDLTQGGGSKLGGISC